MIRMYSYEQEAHQRGYQSILGCDEAGRGPLAGPLVVAGVVLDPSQPIEGLNDSKQLTDKKRRVLFKAIKQKAKAFHIDVIDEETLDQENVYQASKNGMLRCAKAIKTVDYVLTDAMPLKLNDMPVVALIKGDTKSATIAAASILAKVTRDDIMVRLAKKFPHYGFEKHKGYPTKQHLEALNIYGVSAVHRTSFAPVRRIIEKQMSLSV